MIYLILGLIAIVIVASLLGSVIGPIVEGIMKRFHLRPWHIWLIVGGSYGAAFITYSALQGSLASQIIAIILVLFGTFWMLGVLDFSERALEERFKQPEDEL